MTLFYNSFLPNHLVITNVISQQPLIEYFINLRMLCLIFCQVLSSLVDTYSDCMVFDELSTI